MQLLARLLFRILPLVFTALFFISEPALAQVPRNLFDAEYTYSSPSEGDFEDEISLHEGKVNGLYPVTTIKDQGFGFGVGGGFQMNVWDPDNSNIEDLELYKVKLPLVLDFKIVESLFFGLGVTPGLHSDFEDVDEDDFRVEGELKFAYVLDKKLQFVLGAAIGEEFGEAKGYPIGGVIWTPSDAFQFQFLFPKPRAHYAMTKRFRFYLFGEPSGGEWNVGENDEVQLDIQQKGIRLGGGFEFGVTDRTWLYLAGGVEVKRELQLALDDEEVFDDEVDLDDQAFVRVGVRLQQKL